MSRSIPPTASAAARLDDPRPGVRRVAIMDLHAALRDAASAPAAIAALVAHLPHERDERALELLVGALADALSPAAACPLDGPTRTGVLAALRRVYDDPAMPVRAAIAAIRAHDATTAHARPQ